VRAMRVHRALILALVFALAAPHSAFAYLKLSVRTLAGDVVSVRWSRTPVRWFVTDRSVPGVTASELQAALTRAFNTWQGVPTAEIDFQHIGVTSARPSDDDSMNVLGFQDRPELERVLGQTEFTVDRRSGDIVESDIFFNATFSWSVATPGVTGRFDVESVALHEVGHLLGLGHSALGETELMPNGRRRVISSGAVMFPISFGPANTADRELQPDDVAGVSDIYPSSTYRADTGAARGRVTLNGRPILGAHVIAFHPGTGDLIAGFTVNEEGEFELTGLTPGAHVIRVEPLDDADIESFFGSSDQVSINFQVTYLDRLFVAPRGGVGERFDVAVTPK
jgi:Matrixin